MAQLDVFDFRTGGVVGKVEVPEVTRELANDPSSLDFVSNYLYRTKKISFVKTASSKGISDISGTTKKPFKQKGTGNARQGSLRSPQFRGGAVIFGPIPVTATYKINKKEVRLAKKIVLSQLIENSLIKVVSDLSGILKTKDFASYKQALLPGVEKVLFVSSGGSKEGTSYNAGRNLKGVHFDLGLHFNVYKVSRSEVVVITQTALNELFNTLFN